LLSTKETDQAKLDKGSQLVDVPIDEQRAITLKLSPTWKLDSLNSVTLKSFRKIVGYDTFNSILKADRDEKKDTADYYNVTVSMMVKRVPDEKAAAPARDPYDGSRSLAASLDKGFPYDDGDITGANAAPSSRQNLAQDRTVVGKLNGENVSKQALVNLVQDRAGPITVNLAQTSNEQLNFAKKSDGDILSALFDANVTRGALKNLITDKPSPITQKLAQKTDGDILSALFDANVTRGALKNLVTDKPSPIT
jgi:hypothetical protein